MKIRRIVLWTARTLGIVAAFVASSLSSGTAQAYRTAEDSPDFSGQGRVAWKYPSVAFFLSSAGLPPNVEAAAAEQVLNDALSTWGAPECTSVRPYFAGWVEEPPTREDAQNTIGWVSDWALRGFDATSPAQADLSYLGNARGYEIVESDLYLNAADFSWAVAGVEPETDVGTVLTHELGHALGLLHTCEPDGSDGAPACGEVGKAESEATMFPLYSAEQATLADDDTDGICYLYPAVPDACTSCAADEVCIDQHCHAPCGETLCDVGDVCGFWGCVPAGSCTKARCSPESCEDDFACGPQARCSKGACVAGTVVWGEHCAATPDCADGVCVNGLCQPLCRTPTECGKNARCEASVEESARGCEDSRAYSFGMTCRSGEDCASGLCVSTESDDVCTRSCSSTQECPMKWSCEQVEGENVCVPDIVVPAGACSVGGKSGSGSLELIFGILLPLTLVTRRRRQRERTLQTQSGRQLES